MTLNTKLHKKLTGTFCCLLSITKRDSITPRQGVREFQLVGRPVKHNNSSCVSYSNRSSQSAFHMLAILIGYTLAHHGQIYCFRCFQ